MIDSEEKLKTVVVTGVSSGIGWGVAKVLVSEGFRVFGSVRKSADAVRLQQQLGERFDPLLFDVTDPRGVSESASIVRERLGDSTLFGLVNNIGIAVGGPLLQMSCEDFRRQLEVNLLGNLCVTQAFAPMLGTDQKRNGRPGRIVNISSIGGRIALPFLGPYAASKHALEGLSDSLRRELTAYGIEVIVVRPGGIASAMWDKAEAMDVSQISEIYREPVRRFKRRIVSAGRKGLPPERVGRVVLKALTAPRPKLRYAVVVNPIRNWILPRLLPARVVDRILSAQLGMNRRRRNQRGDSL
ncbi:MAG TPA: SDR family oxidoreductase [Candidatus Binataceae bacterium]|nr:SDR family oxidoreductase [Candidatus Binataceae bacterium]